MATKKVRINEVDYEISHFPATKGYDLQQELFEMMLPSFASIFPNFEKIINLIDTKATTKDNKLKASDLASALEGLSLQQLSTAFLHTMSQYNASGLLKELLARTTYKSHPIIDTQDDDLTGLYKVKPRQDTFDGLFAGRLEDGYALALEVVKFSGFFGVILRMKSMILSSLRDTTSPGD